MINLNAVYLLRPREAPTGLLALHNDAFVPDDGSPALAFCSIYTDAPMAYYVDIPYREPAGYHWHGEKGIWHRSLLKLGNRWSGREQHPNYLAGRLAMDACVKAQHCANGRPLRVENPEDYGYLYTETGELLPRPDVSCALCAVGGHELLAFAQLGRDRTNMILYAREQERKAQRILNDSWYEKREAWSWLHKHRAELRAAHLFEKDTS